MSGDMPKLWWSPCWGAVVGRAKHFEALESRRYFDELPEDAVELKPVSDAPAAPGETASCGVCKLGGRVLYIDDRCSEHGDMSW